MFKIVFFFLVIKVFLSWKLLLLVSEGFFFWGEKNRGLYVVCGGIGKWICGVNFFNNCFLLLNVRWWKGIGFVVIEVFFLFLDFLCLIIICFFLLEFFLLELSDESLCNWWVELSSGFVFSINILGFWLVVMKWLG